MTITELIEQLRKTASKGVSVWGDLQIEAADAIESLQATATEYQQAADKMAWDHKVERDTLRQQLAAAQSLIEASRKQEPVFWLNESGQMSATKGWAERQWPSQKLTPLYAAPVVADDVLKDAERYRWLRDNSASISWNPSRFNSEIVSGLSHAGTGYLGFNFEDAIDAAMGGAND